MTAIDQQDVLALLFRQHEEIKDLFRRVSDSRTPDREQAFHELVRFLAVHESAEEIVVHPAAESSDADVVHRRFAEEDDAKQALADLYDLGLDHPEFGARLSMLEASVLQHAEREEVEEFPLLRRDHTEDELMRMGRALLAAESIAPTRPHPHGGETVAANVVAGPPLAVFDRIRDAVRDAMKKSG